MVKTRDMHDFRRMMRGIPGQPLLFHIASGFGASIAGTLASVARGERVRDDDILSALGGDAAVTAAAQTKAAVATSPMRNYALVPVLGIINPRIHLQPFLTSTRWLEDRVREARGDPTVSGILLVVDSPGGFVGGVREAADAVYAAAQKKPVDALVDLLSASAGYWITSQARRIIAVPSADVGSIGVFMAHTDCSQFNEKQGMRVTYIFDGEYKTEGNPDEPLSDAARAHYQGEVKKIGDQFRRAVARGRRVSIDAVAKNFGRGRVVAADDALRVGMIDHVATLPQFLAAGASTGVAAARAWRLAALRSDEGPPAVGSLPLVVPPDQPAAPSPAEIAARRARLSVLAGNGGAPVAQAAESPAYWIRIRGYARHYDGKLVKGKIVDAETFSRCNLSPSKIPMLLNHDATQVIGTWNEIRQTHRGLWVEGRIYPTTPEAKEALELIVNERFNAFSIAYKSLKESKMLFGTKKVECAELTEISIVRDGAQNSARFTYSTGG